MNYTDKEMEKQNAQEYLRWMGVPEELVETVETNEEAMELLEKLRNYSRIL